MIDKQNAELFGALLEKLLQDAYDAGYSEGMAKAYCKIMGRYWRLTLMNGQVQYENHDGN